MFNLAINDKRTNTLWQRTTCTGKGYDKAYVLLGQYLVVKKNKVLFIGWLKDYAGATHTQATKCHEALRDWCEVFL